MENRPRRSSVLHSTVSLLKPWSSPSSQTSVCVPYFCFSHERGNSAWEGRYHSYITEVGGLASPEKQTFSILLPLCLHFNSLILKRRGDGELSGSQLIFAVAFCALRAERVRWRLKTLLYSDRGSLTSAVVPHTAGSSEALRHKHEARL